MSGLVPAPHETNLFKIVMSVRQLFEGRSNATGTVTLAANAASTTVSGLTVAPGCVVLLMPQTANAAAAVATTYIAASGVTKQQFVITHANNAQTDRTFGWVALG